VKTLKEIIVGELVYTQRCGDGGDWGSIAERIVAKYEGQKPEPIEKSFQPCGVVYAENFFSMYSAICLINSKLNEVIDRINKMEAK
jgi:hypothetical protein